MILPEAKVNLQEPPGSHAELPHLMPLTCRPGLRENMAKGGFLGYGDATSDPGTKLRQDRHETRK